MRIRLRTWPGEVWIFSFFTILGLATTYPLILKMSSHIYGTSGDSLTNIYWFWWWKYAWTHGLPVSEVFFMSAPFGLKILNPLLSWPLYSSGLAIGLTFLANEVVAYNLLILLSFPLAAITMYFLVYHFTKDRLASMVSGIIYSFSPYHFWHGFQHLTAAQIQWMPLYALFLFKLSEERSYKNAILCGFLFSVVAMETLYYGYFMLIFTGVFILWRGWQAIRGKKLSSYQAIKHPASSIQDQGSQSSLWKTFRVVLVAVVVALAIILPLTHNIFKTVFISFPGEPIAKRDLSRPLEDLFMYSARPLGYLLPSIDHPILGKYTKNFVKTSFYGGHPIEQTLYLGWVGIVLSFVAIRGWRRKSREQAGKWESGQVSREQRLSGYQVIRLSGKGKNRSLITDYRSRKAVSFFLFVGIVALLFSFGPCLEIGNFRIFFPSYFMYKIIPMVRILARFGVLVLLAISVLTGFGLIVILQRISTPKKRSIFLSLIILLIFFEFTNIPPFHTTDISVTPEVYQWLSRQPGDFIIAEYPLETDSRYLFYQRIHKKRLVNGTIPRDPYAEKVRRAIINVAHPQTPGILKHLGVRYLIFHPEEYLKSGDPEIIGELPELKKVSGLKLVRAFARAEVYEIIAKPIKP